MTNRIGVPTLLHQRGVDLPLHPTDEVVWHKHDMHAAAQRASDTFIRTIRMDRQLPFDDLWELTRKAPHDYLRLAEKTGSLCAFVSFGLAPLPAPGELTTYETRYTVNQLLPPGHGLVAQVKAVKNVTQFSDKDVSDIRSGVARYIAEARHHNEPYLADFVRPNPEQAEAHLRGQFTQGCLVDALEAPTRYLTDIDLYYNYA